MTEDVIRARLSSTLIPLESLLGDWLRAVVVDHLTPVVTKLVTDAQSPIFANDAAVQAACDEAGWDWEPEAGAPSPQDAMRSIIQTAFRIHSCH